MITAWIGFWLFHHFNITPNDWYAFPLIMTLSLIGVIEYIKCYSYVVNKLF